MRGNLLLTSLVGLALVAPAGRADDSVPLSPFSSPPPRVPIEALDPALGEKVRSVLDRPTLSSRSLPETFNTDHGTYRYLLEHPDHAVKLWRQLGAKVADINDRGGGSYLWQDGQGS